MEKELFKNTNLESADKKDSSKNIYTYRLKELG